jgi:hypothetical protein
MPVKDHKPSNIRLLGAIGCVLRGTVEQGWLGRLGSR